MHETKYRDEQGISMHREEMECLCGLVVSVPGYRSKIPGSILGSTRFSENWWVWNDVHSAS
jgi:hypothetical protein